MRTVRGDSLGLSRVFKRASAFVATVIVTPLWKLCLLCVLENRGTLGQIDG